MNPIDIINAHYQENAKAHRILIAHGEQVAEKALRAAGNVMHLQPDLAFIKEASLLHDIGMIMTNTPKFDCHGRHPYICHGILGRELIEKHGLPRHALVCERHVGTGISVEDIDFQKLPLPRRDMRPISIEEQIICYADKFFSKNGNAAAEEKTVDQIIGKLAVWGNDKVILFKRWVDLFGG